MKRTIFVVAIAALTVVALLVGRGETQVAPSQTRVAVINVAAVFVKYDKARFYKSEMENMLKPFKDKAEQYKNQIIQWQTYLKDPKSDPSKRAEGEKAIRDAQRVLEDIELEARKRIGTTQEQQVITLYKELDNAVAGFSAANGISLVLAYGEPVEGDKLDKYSFANINRKMQGMDVGSAQPFFVAKGTEISDSIIDSLNRSYRAAGGQVPPAASTTSALPPPLPGGATIQPVAGKK